MREWISTIPERYPKLRGTLQIVLFNWPFYLCSVLGMAIGCTALKVLSLPSFWHTILALCLGGGTLWTAGSLIASYYIYDYSGMYRWDWLSDLLPESLHRWIHIHAGFDQSSDDLKRLFPGSQGTVLDFYDSTTMTEPSIRRARQARRSESIRSGCTHLPFRESAFEIAFLLFSAHEIRSPEAREQFFCELHRVLKPQGRLLLVEHHRDLPNFLAFGPGFFHFLPRREWMRLARHAGFDVAVSIRKTPFVRAVLMRK